jgi:hypothetical protein
MQKGIRQGVTDIPTVAPVECSNFAQLQAIGVGVIPE